MHANGVGQSLPTTQAGPGRGAGQGPQVARQRQMRALAQLNSWVHAADAMSEDRVQFQAQIHQFIYAAPPADTLSLEHLNLSSLPEFLSALIPSVRRLQLSDNYLRDLSALSGLHHLRELSADRNGLESLASLPQLRNLRMLSVADNPCAYAGQFDIQAYPNLQVAMPRELVRADQAARLQAISDPISEALHFWCRGAPDEQRARARDRIIDFAANQDPEAILDLSNLGLSSLPDNLSALVPALANLNLRDNGLTSLEPLAGLDRLQQLDVSSNRLMALHDMPRLGRLRTFTASNNPGSTSSTLDLTGFMSIHSVYPATWVRPQQRHRATHFTIYEESDPESESDAAGDDAVSLYSGRTVTEREGDDRSEVGGVRAPVAGNPIDHEGDDAMADAPDGADLALREDYESPVAEAVGRWHDGHDVGAAKEHVERFYAAVMPAMLHRDMAVRRDARCLLTLCAGLAFVADNQHPDSAAMLQQDVRSDLLYLERYRHTTLLNDCLSVVDDAIGHCGDRVSYGRMQMKMVIQDHQMTQENWPADRIFAAFDCHFNQHLLDEMAAQICANRSSHESVEFYQSLAAKVAQHYRQQTEATGIVKRGTGLVETAQHSMYGGMFAATGAQVAEAVKRIDEKYTTSGYWARLGTNPGVRSLLVRTFPVEHALWLSAREALEDVASSELMGGPPPSAAEVQAARRAERMAFGDGPGVAPQRSAEERINKAGVMEKEWFERQAYAMSAGLDLLNL